MNYIKDPGAIEKRSMEIVEEGLRAHSFTAEELAVVKRVVHTSGDFRYRDVVCIQPAAIEAGRKAVRSGCAIVTDTKMALAGINKRVLKTLGCTIDSYIDHEDVRRLAESEGITRSMAAMELAAKRNVDIFVVGNAPTALFRLRELVKSRAANPKLVIGVPVGFVGAAESKEALRELDVPSISTVGTKGGSNIAAAIMNAILYLESR